MVTRLQGCCLGAYIGVLQDPSEGFLQQGCQARVVTGEGFPDEAPFRGRCRCGQALP